MNRTVFLIGGILTLIALIIYVEPQKLLLSLTRVNILLFSPVFILLLLILSFLTLRFKIILHYLGVNNIKFNELFGMQATSNLFGHFSPGRSGELIKIYILKKRSRVDYGKNLIVVLIEKIEDIISICSLIIITILLLMSEYRVSHYIYPILMLLILIAIGVVITTNKKVINLVMKFLPIPKKPIGEKMVKIRKDLKNVKFKVIALTMLVTLLVNFISATRIYIIFLSLNISTPFFVVIFIYFVSLLIGILSLIPGGIGSIEISGVLLYSSLLSLDVVAVVTALLLLRFSTYIVDIPLGMIGSYKLKV